ncbi:MAG: carboxypeptidase-like regulatory domain-containing protein, partial [Ignavibacterium sp.]
MKNIVKNFSLKFIQSFSVVGLTVIILTNSIAFAGTTGKITGKVTDEQTGEPVVGANVVVEGTFLGAAADLDGFYSIGNVPPGTYRLIVSAVGYQKTII